MEGVNGDKPTICRVFLGGLLERVENVLNRINRVACCINDIREIVDDFLLNILNSVFVLPPLVGEIGHFVTEIGISHASVILRFLVQVLLSFAIMVNDAVERRLNCIAIDRREDSINSLGFETVCNAAEDAGQRVALLGNTVQDIL